MELTTSMKHLRALLLLFETTLRTAVKTPAEFESQIDNLCHDFKGNLEYLDNPACTLPDTDPESCNFTWSMTDTFVNALASSRTPSREEVIQAIEEHTLSIPPTKPSMKRKTVEVEEETEGSGNETDADADGDIDEGDPHPHSSPAQRNFDDQEYVEDPSSQCSRHSSPSTRRGRSRSSSPESPSRSRHPKSRSGSQEYEYDSDVIAKYATNKWHIYKAAPAEEQCYCCQTSSHRCYEFSQPTRKRVCRRCARLRIRCSTAWKRTKGTQQARPKKRGKTSHREEAPAAANAPRIIGSSKTNAAVIEQLTNLQMQNKTITTQFAELKSTMKALQSDRETANTYVTNNVTQLREELDAMKETMEEVSYQVEVMSETQEAHETSLQEQAAQITALQTDSKRLEDEVNTIARTTQNVAENMREMVAMLSETMKATMDNMAKSMRQTLQEMNKLPDDKSTSPPQSQTPSTQIMPQMIKSPDDKSTSPPHSQTPSTKKPHSRMKNTQDIIKALISEKAIVPHIPVPANQLTLPIDELGKLFDSVIHSNAFEKSVEPLLGGQEEGSYPDTEEEGGQMGEFEEVFNKDNAWRPIPSPSSSMTSRSRSVTPVPRYTRGTREKGIPSQHARGVRSFLKTLSSS